MRGCYASPPFDTSATTAYVFLSPQFRAVTSMKPDTDELPTLSVHDLADKERRAYSRFRVSLAVRCRAEAGVFFRGRAVNLSPIGAGVVFLSDRGPPKITEIHFRGKARESVRVAAHTVRVWRDGRIWLIGCAFDRRLSLSEFNLLTRATT
jgi:hypothetical protein